MHIPSPTSGYFNATTVAMPKTHKVVIDRKRMILRSFCEVPLTGTRCTVGTAYDGSSASSAFASFRSSVSNPSVNQP